MKYLIVVLALVLTAARPLREMREMTQLPPEPPGPIVVGKKGVVVAGDTLVYTISWGPGARATSYDIRTVVSATNGVWSVIADSNGSGKWVTGNGVGALAPGMSGNVTFTTLKTWVAAIPWDSATFTFTVASRNAVGVSASIGATWKVLRRPGLPGPITVDSSLIIVGLRILPDSVTVAPAGGVQFCALVRFADGTYVLRASDAAAPACPVLYQQTIPLAQRLASVGQQAVADSLCVLWEATGGTITPETCRIAPAFLDQRGLLWRVAIR